MAQLNDLTPEEKAKPYSKYFYLEPTPVAPALAERLKDPKPLDSSMVLPIERRNDLLNADCVQVEPGYALLPNGGAYVAMDIPFPGVSGEMIYWWFAWTSLESLRYKIWWPKGHFAMKISDEDRQKVLDPDRPLALKVQGITHYPVEDVGDGPCEVPMAFMRPEDLGYDMSRFKPPAVAALVSGNVSVPTQGQMPDVPILPVVDTGFWREVPGGVEFRGRFWMGYHIHDGKEQFLLPPGARIPDSIPIGLFRHLAEEMVHLAAILPKLYKEQEGKIA